MIKLYQFPSYWGLPNVSPFCMKMETYLRMTGIPFTAIKVGNPRKSPKGKLPYINDNGHVVADTSLIIEYLKQKYGDSLDANLTPLQKAQGLALQRMMEEHLYWSLLYSRWMGDNWPVVKKTFFAKLSLPLRMILPTLAQKSVEKAMQGHGLGLHTTEEIYQFGIQDLQALSAFLSQHEFLLGDKPTSIDACGYAFIANILLAPIESPMKEYAKSQKHFSEYCERMKKLYYSDNGG